MIRGYRGYVPKCIDGDLFDGHIMTPLKTFSQFFEAHGVANNLVNFSLPSKPPIAVHDEGNVLWYLATF